MDAWPFGGRKLAVIAHARVVDEAVDYPVLVVDLLHQGRDGLGLGEVGWDDEDLEVGVLLVEGLAEFGEEVMAASDEHHALDIRCELEGEFGAEARGSASDEGTAELGCGFHRVIDSRDLGECEEIVGGEWN